MYAKVSYIFRSFLSTPVRAYRPVFCLNGLDKTCKRPQKTGLSPP